MGYSGPGLITACPDVGLPLPCSYLDPSMFLPASCVSSPSAFARWYNNEKKP